MATEKRLIDAYVLAEEIELLEITVAGKPARWNDAKHSVLRVIAEQGDVDAAEVVHGRWVDATHIDEDFGEIESYECSVCGKWDYFNTHNYCPNCGAKMDGERKDNG